VTEVASTKSLANQQTAANPVYMGAEIPICGPKEIQQNRDKILRDNNRRREMVAQTERLSGLKSAPDPAV
jgi:hypothetical protein